MNILHIDSCALGDHSPSRQYTAAAVARLAESNPQALVHYRDLAASPLSHVSGPLLQVMRQQWDATLPMNAELRAEALQSASLLQEFLEADLVVIGAPMYNYGMPSTLKAWLDRLLHLSATMDCARSADIRVVLITAGCSGTGEPDTDELMGYHQKRLQAAFRLLGVRHLEVAQGVADLDFKAAA